MSTECEPGECQQKAGTDMDECFLVLTAASFSLFGFISRKSSADISLTADRSAAFFGAQPFRMQLGIF